MGSFTNVLFVCEIVLNPRELINKLINESSTPALNHLFMNTAEDMKWWITLISDMIFLYSFQKSKFESSLFSCYVILLQYIRVTVPPNNIGNLKNAWISLH